MLLPRDISSFFSFFFNDTATTEIYTLSLHDALPIWPSCIAPPVVPSRETLPLFPRSDRKSTRLNSSHSQISYAVFCFKKKKKNIISSNINKKNKKQNKINTPTIKT